MTGKLLEYPLDTIKVRLQTSSDGFKGPLDCLIKTVKFEGFSALYKVNCSFSFSFFKLKF